jgi:hypothetical protein
MNIKFEVEVLCKNLGIKLEDIKLRNELLACRVAPVKERNPDFNIKSSAARSLHLPRCLRPASGQDPDAQSMALPGWLACRHH